MDSLHKLEQIFGKFPGIGSRQARRLAFFIAESGTLFRNELLRAIKEVDKNIAQCRECFAYFSTSTHSSLCSLCAKTENIEKLLIVQKNIDLENMVKAGQFGGKYFILGGLISIRDEKNGNKIRAKELLARAERDAPKGLKEIIIALNANPEGDSTALFLMEMLEPLKNKYNVTISRLGRGLSTGTELEYSDTETIKEALLNRK